MWITVFQDVMPCSLAEFYQRNGRMYSYRGRKLNHTQNVGLRYGDRKDRHSSMSKPGRWGKHS
jgi:hypothetical protein